MKETLKRIAINALTFVLTILVLVFSFFTIVAIFT
jgi:hypothetical protein